MNVSGEALAAGKIEANLRGAIPAASALPLTLAAAAHPCSQFAFVYLPSLNLHDDKKLAERFLHFGYHLIAVVAFG